MVMACNTASVRLEDSPSVRSRADELGLDLYSMMDLLDPLLRRKTTPIPHVRVCVMGTEHTVGRPVCREHLQNAGAREVIPRGQPDRARPRTPATHINGGTPNYPR